MNRGSRVKMIGIVCWGPIEALSNGYFIRVYSLAESIIQYLKKPLVIIEYSEDLSSKPYKVMMLSELPIVKIQAPGNEKHVSNSFSKYMRFLLYQVVNTFKLRRILRKFHAIIVGSGLFAPTSLLIKLLSKNAIVVADPQMLLSEREERAGRKFLAIFLGLFEKIYFRSSNFIIAISKNMKSTIIRKFGIPGERIVIIPHSLPRKLLRTLSCEDEKTSDSIIRLFFVGSLKARQNLEAVTFPIRVLPIVLSQNNKDVELVIAGSVDEEVYRYLRELSEKYGVSRHVKILGYVENLDEVVCESDVLLAPMFTMSGVSTKMLYYLRFPNKVIVASKEAIEGIEELVKMHGSVIIAENPKDFVLKLIGVVKNYAFSPSK